MEISATFLHHITHDSAQSLDNVGNSKMIFDLCTKTETEKHEISHTLPIAQIDKIVIKK